MRVSVLGGGRGERATPFVYVYAWFMYPKVER